MKQNVDACRDTQTECSTLDSAARRAEKQASRDQDERDLAEGRVTREELQRRNCAFRTLAKAPIDWAAVPKRAK